MKFEASNRHSDGYFLEVNSNEICQNLRIG
jgi:hypothetical protein